MLCDVTRGQMAVQRRLFLLAIASSPAGILGVLFHRQVEEAATSLVFIGLAFIVTGFMNWSTRGLSGIRREPTVPIAAGIGGAQALAAVVRGISRSRSTGGAARWGGLDPSRAATR